MSKLYLAIFLTYLGLTVFVLIDFGEANEITSSNHYRARRYLSFLNNSHVFMRVNSKVNMVPWTQIFQQVLAFRMNWDSPPDSFHPYHHLNRRDVYNRLELLIDKNGLNGFHCVRRAICELDGISKPRRVYHKILKIVFRKKLSTERWHKTTETDCELSIASCPFSLLDVSTYTDL